MKKLFLIISMLFAINSNAYYNITFNFRNEKSAQGFFDWIKDNPNYKCYLSRHKPDDGSRSVICSTNEYDDNVFSTARDQFGGYCHFW